MRVYISGPMTGKPDNNFSEFEYSAYRLRGDGHFVINPAELSELYGTPEELEKSFRAMYNLPRKDGVLQMEYMAHESYLARAVMDADLAAVRSCDAIYLLRGWETSRGAKKELAEAIAHGLTVMLEGGAE